MRQKNYHGKTIYITGGSSGIGLAVAKAFARRGAHTILFAREEERLENASKELDRLRVFKAKKFAYLPTDVSALDNLDAKMERAVTAYGIPYVLVNSAGTAYANYFEDTPIEKFHEMVRVNLFGTRNTVSCIAPRMKENREGYIVNISSVAGFIGVFGYAAYSASKFAVMAFSESFRGELRPYRIKVSVLCPPDTDTPLLREENKTKPPETRAIAGNAGVMSVRNVTEALIKGMDKNKFMIIPGLEGKLIYLAKRYVPALVNYIMDKEVKKAVKV